nr:hypothetical protein [Enterococcus innesii]
MNNQHSNGFNGNVAVDSISIGDQVEISISEPANATVGQAYRTFFATSSVKSEVIQQLTYRERERPLQQVHRMSSSA